MTSWWVGHPPVSGPIPVDEGGAAHTVEWREGADLVLAAHPDPVATRTLAALGGEACACLDAHAAWHAQFEEPSILVVGRRRAGESLRADPSTLGRFEREAQRWRSYSSMVGARTAGTRAEHDVAVAVGLQRLLAAHPAFEHRLQLAVIAAADARWGDEAFRSRHGAALGAALAARAVPPLAAAGISVDPSFVEIGEPPTTDGVVRLPLRWLTDVWGRGVACVDGSFVLAVEDVDDGGRRLTVSTAGGGKVRVVRGVVTNDDDWRLDRA